MLERFNALPLYQQLGILLAIGAALCLVLEYTSLDIILPGLNPITAAKAEREQLVQRHGQLEREVAQLELFQQQLAEKQRELAQIQAALERSRVQVPNEKRTDDFMRTLENSSLSAQVSLRRLVAQNIVYRDFYAEMPFQVELDGPYYNLRDYFERVTRTARIISVGGINFQTLDTSNKYPYVPNSTVTGQCRVTTYYIPSEAELAASAPPQQPGQPAAQPPARPVAPPTPPAR